LSGEHLMEERDSKPRKQSSAVDIPHLEGDHPQSEHVRLARGETGCSIIEAEELGCHPSGRSLEARSGSLSTVESGDASEPEIVEPCTTRPINENIILRWEMVRLPQAEAQKPMRTPFKSP